jgi:hypothetical protein
VDKSNSVTNLKIPLRVTTDLTYATGITMQMTQYVYLMTLAEHDLQTSILINHK